ncbi:MAG: M48 family metallopeptidase [Elusimicrobiaceae bacterium]|nr:M48 family metallopeptidase [Elusimicrobiaceae bacterium]
MITTPLNVYDEIATNRRKTILILLLFPLVLAGLIYATVFLVFYFVGLDAQQATQAINFQEINLISTIAASITVALAIIWAFVSWFGGDHIVLDSAGAQEISRATHPEIFVLVENLTIATGLPLPRIYIMDDESLNAFATGRDPEHASLALTKGIIKRLNRAELEGVIGHELGHIANRDIRLTMLVATYIGAISLMGQILIRLAASSSKNRRGKNGGQITILLLILGFVFIIYGAVFAPLIMFALSRRREFQADATSAYMTRNPLALASALEKISTDSRVEALDGKSMVSAACIAHAGAPQASLTSLFATHPPIEERIAKLRAM